MSTMSIVVLALLAALVNAAAVVAGLSLVWETPRRRRPTQPPFVDEWDSLAPTASLQPVYPTRARTRATRESSIRAS